MAITKYIDDPDFELATAVYDDITLTTKSADGVYQFNGKTRIQLNGLLGSVSDCPSCGIPCGGTLTPPAGNEGIYQLDISVGSTSSDVGAIIIFFNPRSIPDGIRVSYDGVYYNKLYNNVDGIIQSTSGVADAFTILGNPLDACVPVSGNFDFFDGYDSSGWLPGTPTTKNITVNAGDDVRGGVGMQNLMVIPKPNGNPGNLRIEVLGPCDSTLWDVSVGCPAELPSFEGKFIDDRVVCETEDTTFYFARFNNHTNPYPILDNPIFEDANGEQLVEDGNYSMASNYLITVFDGIVTNLTACGSSAPQPTYKPYTASSYHINNGSNQCGQTSYPIIGVHDGANDYVEVGDKMFIANTMTPDGGAWRKHNVLNSGDQHFVTYTDMSGEVLYKNPC